jgi:ABC-type multidrug transport system fused ATPase/permease subunit
MGSPIADISMFFHNVVINVPNSVTTFVVSTIWVFFWDWTLRRVLIFMVVATVLTMRLAAAGYKKLIQRYQAMETGIIGRVADIFRGNRDVKIHAVEERMAQAFRQSADQLRRQAYQPDVETHKINMRPEALNEALERVLIGRTAIFIAHRLSTVKNCDRVLVIERRQIVQDGTFSDLSERAGLFRKMVETDKFELSVGTPSRSSTPQKRKWL